MCDPQNACSTATVTLDVVNQPPTGVTDFYNIHGFTTVGPLLANDSDPDGDGIRCGDFGHNCIETFPQHGTLNGVATDRWAYIPAFGYTGSDSFTYNVCDDPGLCTQTTVNLSVNNNTPTAGNDEYKIFRPFTQIGPLRVNDSDLDPNDTISEPNLLTFPQHGSLSGITADIKSYNPDPGFAGTDGFTYQICDNLGKCATATVTLYVIGKDSNNGPCEHCNGAVGRPINISNGNMYLEQNDYQLPGVGSAINVGRTYNSNSQQIGLFGRGWSTAYDESIVTYDNNLVRFNHAGGRAVYLGRPVGSSGAFTDLIGDLHQQVTQGSGFTLAMKDGSAKQFNSAGKLLSTTDRNGNTTTLAYGATGFLSAVTDAFGRVLTVNTNTNGQVTSISDPLGTIATYTYGAGSELLSVTYADNSAFNFSYDGSFRLTSVTDALGNVVESHTYDGQGRAITSEKHGGVDHYSLSYVSATETDVIDGLGRITKYTFDTSKIRNVVTRVEGLCNCGGGSGSQVQTWIYDAQLNITSITDISEDPAGLAGGVNGYAYTRNNPLTRKDPSGLYDIDVHYYLTYYLAFATGCFTREEARQMAEGDLHSDIDDDKKPGWGKKWEWRWYGRVAVPYPEQQKRNADFHAFGTHEQNARRAAELWSQATGGTGGSWQFGTYLHFLQDSYSHSEYAGNTTWGQSSGLNSRDHTSFDPEKAMKMAHATYDALKKFAEMRGCKCHEPDWDIVRKFVDIGYDRSTLLGAGGEYLGGVSDEQLMQKIGILNVPWRSRTGR